jgi:hypothetical protein
VRPSQAEVRKRPSDGFDALETINCPLSSRSVAVTERFRSIPPTGLPRLRSPDHYLAFIIGMMSQRKRSLSDIPAAAGTENKPNNSKLRRASASSHAAELLLLLSRPEAKIATSQSEAISENMVGPQDRLPGTQSDPSTIVSGICNPTANNIETAPAVKKEITKSHSSENSRNYSTRRHLHNIAQGEPSALSHSVDHANGSAAVVTSNRIARHKHNYSQGNLSPLAAPPQLPNVKSGSIVKRIDQRR